MSLFTDDFFPFITAYLPALLDRYRRFSYLPHTVFALIGMVPVQPYIGRYMRSQEDGMFLLRDHFRLLATVERWDLLSLCPVS